MLLYASLSFLCVPHYVHILTRQSLDSGKKAGQERKCGRSNNRVPHTQSTQSRWGFSLADRPKFAGDVPDVGGEVAQNRAEAGGQEAGVGEDGHLSTVIRHQGHFSIFQLESNHWWCCWDSSFLLSWQPKIFLWRCLAMSHIYTMFTKCFSTV